MREAREKGRRMLMIDSKHILLAKPEAKASPLSTAMYQGS